MKVIHMMKEEYIVDTYLAIFFCSRESVCKCVYICVSVCLSVCVCVCVVATCACCSFLETRSD